MRGSSHELARMADQAGLEWGDLRVQMFRVRRRLEELGEKDESQLDEHGDGANVATMNREVARLEKKLLKVEKPQSQERKDDVNQRFAGDDNVSFLLRRALARCGTPAEASKFFSAARQQAGLFGDPSGRVFSSDEIEDTCSKCTFEFSRRALDEADPEDEDDQKIEDAGVKKKGAGRGRKRKGTDEKAKVKKQQVKRTDKTNEQANEEDEDEEEEDLMCEQGIDLDVVLDEKEMRGLIDMFESPCAPLDGPSQDAWTKPLPAGSWVADDRGLLGRLNRRGVMAADELAGRIPGPGQYSFNSYVTGRLKFGKIGIDMPCEPNKECPPLQPHQQSVAFLLHPASPIERLLVDHPTGCGKTREMIAVLDNYFLDPRPKVPIFPTESVCRNFYLELLRWPSRYRDFFCCEDPILAQRAAGLPPLPVLDSAEKSGSDRGSAATGEAGEEQESGTGEAIAAGGEAVEDQEPQPAAPTALWTSVRHNMWTLAGIPEAELRSIVVRYREVLEMGGTYVCGKLRKGRRFHFRAKNPGEQFPCAPLRALGYTSAGGSNIKLEPSTGYPMSSLFKVGFREPFTNVYDRKIVLMDEVHNLVRSNTRYTSQLEVLRSKLSKAEDLVLVGFTATPIPNDISEGRLLLDTIKGEAHLGLSDEGFISSFPFKPPHLFPKSFPAGVPDTALTASVQKALCTEVELHGESLLAYDLHARDPETTGKQLRVYCNMFCWGSAFHDGKMGCKAEVLARPDALAPKLAAIVREVTTPAEGERTKALVLVQRKSGFTALIALMREAARAATPPFEVATMEELSEFNAPDNARGERFMVLVADSKECGEGISFKAVRRQFMADVPQTPADFIQFCGRACRMYGHQILDPVERTLNFSIYTAVLPGWLRDDALSVWCYRVYARRGEPCAEAERLARQLREKFEAARVHTLEDFKVLVDAFGRQRLQELEDKEGMKQAEAVVRKADAHDKKMEAIAKKAAAEAKKVAAEARKAEAEAAKEAKKSGAGAKGKAKAKAKGKAKTKGEEEGEEAEVEAKAKAEAEAAAAELEAEEAASKRIKKPRSAKLSTTDVADFFEAMGLAEEAQSLRGQHGDGNANLAEESADEDGGAEGGQKVEKSDAATADGATESQMEPESQKRQKVVERSDSFEGDLEGEVDMSQMPVQEECQESRRQSGQMSLRDVEGGGTIDPRKAVRNLLRATLKLHTDSQAALKRMCADAGQSEDQRAMVELQELYDEFLPALSVIRNTAVDKMVLSRPEDREMLARAAAGAGKKKPAERKRNPKALEANPAVDEDTEAAAVAADTAAAPVAGVPSPARKRGRKAKAA